MSTAIRSRFVWYIPAVILIAVPGMPGLRRAVAQNCVEFLPPASEIAGQPLSHWFAEYWRWTVETPTARNPNFTAGVACTSGQDELPVFFCPFPRSRTAVRPTSPWSYLA